MQQLAHVRLLESLDFEWAGCSRACSAARRATLLVCAVAKAELDIWLRRPVTSIYPPLACHLSQCPAGLPAEIVRRPGDVENVLRLLLNQLRQVKVPAGKAEAEKELVMTAGKAHLDLLEQYRRLYLKSRALGSAQVGSGACALLAC